MEFPDSDTQTLESMALRNFTKLSRQIKTEKKIAPHLCRVVVLKMLQDLFREEISQIESTLHLRKLDLESNVWKQILRSEFGT